MIYNEAKLIVTMFQYRIVDILHNQQITKNANYVYMPLSDRMSDKSGSQLYANVVCTLFALDESENS